MAKTTGKKAATKGASSAGKGAAKKAATNSRTNSSKAAAPKKAAAKKAATKKGAPINEQAMFDELFLDSLKDMYGAEKQLLKALPKLRKNATSQELQQAFEDHTQVTQEQVGRLEQVFELLGKKPQAKKCLAMEGLVKEADEIISETQKGTLTRDVALIMAAQKVEHYEIASYGSLATLAATMQEQQIKELLGQTLQEEKDTDQLLTEIAENNVNEQAARNESSQSEDEEE